MTKLTKVQKFEMILAKVADDEMLTDFITNEIELIKKKNANRKPSKTQTENVAYAETIKAILTEEGQTVSEIMKCDNTLAELSNQKVSAILNGMVKAGEVVKTTDKKKSYFSLPIEEEEVEEVED